MKNKLKSHIRKNTGMISLGELQSIMPGHMEYKDFAEMINTFEQEGMIRPVKTHGQNSKKPRLSNTYRISKSYFRDELNDVIQKVKISLKSDLDISCYYRAGLEELKRDEADIRLIDEYLHADGFPTVEASSAERSYQICADEKWIDEKGGKKILQKLGIIENLNISYQNDPVMIAVNPGTFKREEHMHLIVENKSTFHMFLKLLCQTDFTSLVYGCGWKIVSNVGMIESQAGTKGKKNRFYYFGDIDNEGISIWSSLNEKKCVFPATGFYEALMKKRSAKAKKNHRFNEAAVSLFVSYFEEATASDIAGFLESESYHPQEDIEIEEAAEIWRNGKWRV